MSERNLNPEEYVAMHKKAFRVAFDYLNSHFPPGNGEEWWQNTAMDAEGAYCANGKDELTQQLVLGVYNYLEKEWKKRYGKTEN